MGSVKHTPATSHKLDAHRQAIETATKTGQVPIQRIAIATIKPSPENDRLYRPVDPADPDVAALAQSILDHGIKEPLVVSVDGYIISGHRRYTAAKLAGLKSVPCRIENIIRTGNEDAFTVLLREYNRQRVKTSQEMLREELVSLNPDECYREVVEFRARKSAVSVPTITLGKTQRRAQISDAKRPMLEAAQRVLEEYREFWPLNNRQIFYALLNDPPLRHASKPASRYVNDLASYKDLCDLLTRARFSGDIPMDAIEDATRPFFNHRGFDSVQHFIRQEMDNLFRGFHRRKQRSQPNHIEVLVEKNTVISICDPICEQYGIDMTSMRGFCSTPAKHDIAERFRRSGKDRLVLLIVSDFDPEGESIAESTARSLRDDFDIANVTGIKVALTKSQAQHYKLPEDATAKVDSSRSPAFVQAHGKHVWELEALPPRTLQELLEKAIVDVLDMEAFQAEIEAERAESVFLIGARNMVVAALKDIDFGEGNQ